MSRQEIASLVTAARKRAGYDTIYAFCKATRLSTGQLAEIESGTSSPSVATLEKIFSAIGWHVTVTFDKKE